MEIALVYDKSGQIDDIGAKSIETAMKILRQPRNVANRKVLDKRLRILEQSFNAIPTRSPLLPPKLDTRSLFAQRSLSPATTSSTSWTPIPTSVTSNPTFDFNFMRTGRLSTASVTESVASFDAWTPTNFTDRFSTSPEVESSKNDILEAFLSTISDDPYPPSQSLENSGMFSMHSDSPTLPGMIVPTIFDWSNPSSFSDEDNESKTAFGASPSDVSPPNYPPMFIGSFCSSEETSPENKSFGNYKPEVYGFKDNNGGFQQDNNGDGNSHIHTAPNLFSEESGWAV
jgi:hypothetical protein